MKVGGILGHSTVDYPKKVSAVVFLCGCSFKCPWCHNPELVLGEHCKNMEVDEIVNQLKENYLIDAVCITGGEPLLQFETINLLKKIKEDTSQEKKKHKKGFGPPKPLLTHPSGEQKEQKKKSEKLTEEKIKEIKSSLKPKSEISKIPSKPPKAPKP